MENIMFYINRVFDIFLQNPIPQSIWLIAFWFSAYNFLFCKDKKFIIFTAISSFFWSLHFLSLWLSTTWVLTMWLISAWIVNTFDIFKNLISLKYEKNIYWVIWITIIYLIIWFFTIDTYISVIPTITAIFSTYLVFYVRGIYLNIWFLFIILLYMIFNYFSHSIWWLSTDIFLFFFWIFWIIRMLREQKKL